VRGLYVISFFSTRTDVLEFSKSRLNPLLAENPFLLETGLEPPTCVGAHPPRQIGGMTRRFSMRLRTSFTAARSILSRSDTQPPGITAPPTTREQAGCSP